MARAEARRAHASEEIVRLLYQEVELQGGEFREILSFERLADGGKIKIAKRKQNRGRCGSAFAVVLKPINEALQVV